MKTSPFIIAAYLLAPTLGLAQEDTYNASFCSSMGGEAEVRYEYTYPAGTSYIRVDCETADTVYEGGLDKRSKPGQRTASALCCPSDGQETRRGDLQHGRKNRAI